MFNWFIKVPIIDWRWSTVITIEESVISRYSIYADLIRPSRSGQAARCRQPCHRHGRPVRRVPATIKVRPCRTTRPLIDGRSTGNGVIWQDTYLICLSRRCAMQPVNIDQSARSAHHVPSTTRRSEIYSMYSKMSLSLSSVRSRCKRCSVQFMQQKWCTPAMYPPRSGDGSKKCLLFFSSLHMSLPSI